MHSELKPNTPTYYAVIPADVRYCKLLKANAKLLYGELTALANKEGFCWATNGYFADLYDVDNRAVTSWLSQLQEQGFIRIELQKNERGTLRNIYILAPTPQEQIHAPVGTNSPTRRNKNTTPPLVKKHHHNNTSLKSTTVNNDNSKELSLLAKKENENFGNFETPENPLVSTQDEKEKSCAKKEKATAITKEFAERGLQLFELAPNQPTDKWYFTNKEKYGVSTFWAIFERMHVWCENNPKKTYKAPASAFIKWSINDNGLDAFGALQGYWEANTGTPYYLSLTDASIEHKLALETIGTKVKQAMEQKGSMMPLQDAVRMFFDKMPDRWRGEWFDLAKIAKNMAVILAEIVKPTVRANPYQKGGVVVTQELVEGTIDLVRQKREKKEAEAQLMRDLGLTQ